MTTMDTKEKLDFMRSFIDMMEDERLENGLDMMVEYFFRMAHKQNYIIVKVTERYGYGAPEIHYEFFEKMSDALDRVDALRFCGYKVEITL